MSKRLKMMIVFCGFVAMGLTLVGGQKTFASSLTDGLMYKAVYQGVYRCYKNGYIKSSFSVNDYKNIGSLINKDSGGTYVPLVTGAKTGSYKIGDSNLTCKQLFKGGSYGAGAAGSNDDLLTANGKSAPSISNTEAVNKYLKNMGYTISEDSSKSGATCFYLSYTEKKEGSSKKGNTNKLCKSSSGKAYTEGRELKAQADLRKPTFTVEGDEICFYLPSGGTSHAAGRSCKKSSQVKLTKNGVRDFVLGICKNGGKCETTKGTFVFSTKDPATKTTSGASQKAKFKSGDGKTAGKIAIKYLSDGAYTNAGYDKKGSHAKSFAVSRLEKRLLYQWYFKNYYGMDVKCNTKESSAAYDGTIYWLKGGERIAEKCYVNKSKMNTNRKNLAVNGIDDDTGFFKNGTIGGADALIDEINKLDKKYTKDELEAVKKLKENAKEKEEDTAEKKNNESIEDMCNEAGLKGLSWVACPVMSSTEETVSGLDAMIGSWLNVDTDLYKTDSPTYQVWEIMRNIANVALVIVLLVIIFSQLTGVGIDNYGIKKMLPRLIAMAILVNLSYLACQLVIDLSNILGVSLNTLFRGIGDSVTPNAASLIGEGFISGIIASLFGAAGIAGAGAGTAATLISIIGPAGTTAAAAGGAVLSAPLVVVVILLALIPVLLAVLLFFLMLGARMILVILCTAVAPVVCVLYILPNTQKWAKKWWSLFFAMLVMYPICGAIAGISYLIKAMVLNMDGVHLWMAVVAMVGPFLPFFLLPTLLKNAISALGNVGGALMTMGNKVTSGAGNIRSAVEKSDRYQDAMKYSQNEASGARAKKIADALANKTNRTAAEDMRYAQAEARYAAYTNTKDKAYKEINDHKSLDDVKSDAEKAIENKDWTRLNADFMSMEDKGGAGKVFKMLGESLDAESLNALRKNDSRSYDYLMQGLNKSSSDVEKGFAKYRMQGGSAGFTDWVNGSYTDEQKAADTKAGIKSEFTSYADYLKSRGTGAMNNYTKDEMEFVKDNAKALRENMGEAFGHTVGSALVSSSDARAQTQAEGILTEQIANGGLEASSLGLTAESLGSMRGATAEALEQGYTERRGMTKEQARNTIRSQLAEQIATAQSDPRIMSSMNQSVKDMLGIDGTSTGSAGAGAGSSGAGASTTGASGGSKVPPSGAAREGEEFSVHNPSRPVVDANDYVDYQQGSPLPKEPAKNSNAHDQYRPVTDPNDFIDYQQGR